MYTQEFNFESDLMSNLLWQDDYPENIKGLMQRKEQWYQDNMSLFLPDWITNVFNLKTANAFGCVVWGIILNIPILVDDSPVGNAEVKFGFEPDRGNFDNANFVFLNVGGITLTLGEARRLLRIQYYKQTVSPTVANINYMLFDVFGDLGNAWVIEGGLGTSIPFDKRFGVGLKRGNFRSSNFSNVNTSVAAIIKPMTQTYLMNFDLSSRFLQTLKDFDVLPRGSGVESSIVGVP